MLAATKLPVPWEYTIVLSKAAGPEPRAAAHTFSFNSASFHAVEDMSWRRKTRVEQLGVSSTMSPQYSRRSVVIGPSSAGAVVW